MININLVTATTVATMRVLVVLIVAIDTQQTATLLSLLHKHVYRST